MNNVFIFQTLQVAFQTATLEFSEITVPKKSRSSVDRSCQNARTQGEEPTSYGSWCREVAIRTSMLWDV